MKLNNNEIDKMMLAFGFRKTSFKTGDTKKPEQLVQYDNGKLPFRSIITRYQIKRIIDYVNKRP